MALYMTDTLLVLCGRQLAEIVSEFAYFHNPHANKYAKEP